MPIHVEQDFSTLAECLAHVQATYGGTTAVQAHDRRGQTSLGVVRVPSFLFRGEASQYSATTATMQRIATDPTLSERARQLLPKIARMLECQIREFIPMPMMDSAGYAQHYGLPTELIDLTSSVEVAGYFASSGAVGAQGYVGVFPTASLVRSSILIDLRNHDLAHRPRRQHAFALYNHRHTDIKADACTEELGSRWVGFTLQADDKVRFQTSRALLATATDPAAGALQLAVDSMVQEHGKLPDEIALWLSRHIAPAPFVTKVREGSSPGQLSEVDLIPLAAAEAFFDEAAEREHSYRYWSSRFAVSDRCAGMWMATSQ